MYFVLLSCGYCCKNTANSEVCTCCLCVALKVIAKNGLVLANVVSYVLFDYLPFFFVFFLLNRFNHVWELLAVAHTLRCSEMDSYGRCRFFGFSNAWRVIEKSCCILRGAQVRLAAPSKLIQPP